MSSTPSQAATSPITGVGSSPLQPTGEATLTRVYARIQARLARDASSDDDACAAHVASIRP